MYTNTENTNQMRRVSAFAPAGLNTQKAAAAPQPTGLATAKQSALRGPFAPSAAANRMQASRQSHFNGFQPQHQSQSGLHRPIVQGNSHLKDEPVLHKLPTTISQQHITKPKQQPQQQQQIHRYRETGEDNDEEEEEQDKNTKRHNDQDDDGLVQLPLPNIGFQLDEDIDSIEKSFYLNMQSVTGAEDGIVETDIHVDGAESLMELEEEFSAMSMKLNDRPTDYNDLTTLSTYGDQIGITSIPVNCFSIAAPSQDGGLCISTPQQSLHVKKEIMEMRKTISVIRAQMLSSVHTNPEQIIDSTHQLIEYIQVYNSRNPGYKREFSEIHERRWTAVDYMWRIANQNKMNFETFCHGVHILDRVLSIPSIPSSSSNDLQLTSLVCLFLAYKMIEKRIAAAASIHGSIGPNKFSREVIQEREQVILNQLQFQVSPTSIYDMTYQLSLLFASTRQRDTPMEHRTSTDDLGIKSGRFARLKCMLQFLTYCVITSSLYLQYNPFALACAITMTAVGVITTDFSQVWPLSMAMLTGVLPEDVMAEIEFVTQTNRSVKTVMNARGGYVSASALEAFATLTTYNVAGFKIDFNELQGRIHHSHKIAQEWLKANDIKLPMLRRICGVQQTILRAHSILDQRIVERKPAPAHKSHFQSPPRNNNSNIVRPAHQQSPILSREQEIQKNGSSASTTPEFLAVLMIDLNQKSAFAVSNDGSMTQSMQEDLVGSNPICIKVWMNENSLCDMKFGYDVLDDYRAALRKKEWEEMKAKQALQNPPKQMQQQAHYQPVYQSPFGSAANDDGNQRTPSRVRKQPGMLEDFQSPKHNTIPRRVVMQPPTQQQQQTNNVPPQPQPQEKKSAVEITNKRQKKGKENAAGDNSGCTIM